jgi:coenzyme PQQ precursor peptide PqqA
MNKSQEEKIKMWTKPVAIEMSCGCEINMYAPAEGDRPLF